MTFDRAVAVLRGEKALVDRGDGIYLEDEEPEVRAEWEQELRERYGCACLIRKEWYRPVALVMDFGPRDAPAGSIEKINRGKIRASHYAGEGEIAVVSKSWGDTAFVDRDVLKGAAAQALGYIFEKIDPVPVWAQKYVSVSPTQAVMVFDAVGPWDLRGHSIWYPQDTIRDRLYSVEAAMPPSLKKDFRVERAEIRKRNTGGWLRMVVGAGTAAEYEVQVPRDPFVCWSLWRTSGAHLMPKYKPVSESGLRLAGDEPCHTDWMLVAFPDRDLVDVYEDKNIRAASYDLQAKVQEEVLGFKAAVLSGRGFVSGKVVQPGEPGEKIPAGSILVLPNARPEWESMVRAAVATIVPVGGGSCVIWQWWLGRPGGSSCGCQGVRNCILRGLFSGWIRRRVRYGFHRSRCGGLLAR